MPTAYEKLDKTLFFPLAPSAALPDVVAGRDKQDAAGTSAVGMPLGIPAAGLPAAGSERPRRDLRRAERSRQPDCPVGTRITVELLLRARCAPSAMNRPPGVIVVVTTRRCSQNLPTFPAIRPRCGIGARWRASSARDLTRIPVSWPSLRLVGDGRFGRLPENLLSRTMPRGWGRVDGRISPQRAGEGRSQYSGTAGVRRTAERDSDRVSGRDPGA